MTTYSMIAWDTGSQQDVMWTTTDYSAIPLSTETSPNYTGTLVEICILDDEAETGISVSTSTIQTTFLSSNTFAGTVPKLLGAYRLVAGTYPAPSAEFGCGDPFYTATIELRDENSLLLATLGGAPGGVAWRTANQGYTLAATTTVSLYGYTNTAGQPAFIHGFLFN